MIWDEFEKLFRDQLELAVQNAERRFKIDLPRKYRIRLSSRGTVRGNELFDIDATLKHLYREDQLYPLYVDLAVEAVSIDRAFTIVLVSAAKSELVPFELTWNYKSGAGPFKQQINEELSIVPD